jgi:hypothetical protein
MRTIAEMLSQFVYHPATTETAPKHATVRSTVIELARKWWDTLPDSPEKTLAFRKLQEASMYANLAVALMAPAAQEGTEAIARVLPMETAASNEHLTSVEADTDTGYSTAICLNGQCNWTWREMSLVMTLEEAVKRHAASVNA